MMQTSGVSVWCARASVGNVWKSTALLSVVVAGLLGSISVWSAEPESESATGAVWVTWHNGNRLLATKVVADAETVRVESPLFGQPLELDRNVLATIRQDSLVERGAEESQTAAEESQTVTEVAPEVVRARIDLSNGDVLFGTLVGVDGDTVQLQSPRHGKVVLLRSHVYRMVASTPDELLFASSGRLKDWKDLQGRKLVDWEDVVGGGVHTTKFAAGIGHECSLPELVRLQIDLSWNEGPGFSLSLLQRGKSASAKGVFGRLARGLGIPAPSSNSSGSRGLEIPLFHLTLWDDEIVVETLNDFVPVATLKPDQKELQIELFWDQKKGRVWVRTADMKKPVEISVARPRGGWKTGVFFRNFGKDIEVERVRLLRWSGDLKADQKKESATVVTVEGKRLTERVVSFDEKKAMLVLEGGVEVPLEGIAEVYLGGEAPSGSPSAELDWLAYSDGSQVHGKLQKIDTGQAWMQIAASPAVLPCRFDRQFTQLTFGGKKAETSKAPWTLRATEGELAGHLAVVELHGRSTLAWRPTGAKTSVAVVGGRGTEIEKNLEERLPDRISVQKLPEALDVLYLTNQDVIPAKVFALEGDKLKYRVPGGKEAELEAGKVRAIGFAGEAGIGDFVSHPKWKDKASSPENIKREEGRIEFYGDGKTSNADVLAIPAVGFRLRRSANHLVQVTVKMFVDMQDSQSKKAVQLGMYLSGRDLYISFDYGNEESGFQGFPQTQGKSTLDFAVEVKEGKAILSVDGEAADEVELPESFKPGKGIEIEVENNGPRSQTKPVVTFSNFRLLGASDPFAKISDKDKQIVLHIPRRFRRRPATHLLLAKTGDVLRGRLGGFDEEKLEFTVRTVPQRIPRSRLAGVLWLDPVRTTGTGDEAKAGKETEKGRVSRPTTLPPGAVRILTSTGRYVMTPESLEDDRLVGESSWVGRVSVPVDDILLVETGKTLRPVTETPFGDWHPQIAEEPTPPSKQQRP